MSMLLTGCQHLEPELTIDDRLGSNPYRSQLRWVSGAPQEPVIEIRSVAADGNLWTRMRQGFVLQSKAADNGRVDQQRRWLLDRPAFLDSAAGQGSRYLHFIVGELAKRNMPMELALLPAIESAYNPMARSPAQAVGLWQFIPMTGRRYALEQEKGYDERRDIPASTRAALDYLGYLHGYFDGDWLLALAAYNAGEGRVSEAVARNRARGLPTDYWHLSLPGETRNYVPRLLALSQLVRAPADYGVALAPIADRPYFSSIELTDRVDLARLASLSGVDARELRLLNPAGSGHARGRVLLPLSAAQRVVQQPALLAQAAAEPAPAPASRSAVAQAAKVELPVSEVPVADVPVSDVPVSDMPVAKTSSAVPSPVAVDDPLAVLAAQSDDPPQRSAVTYYRVRKGDSLEQIASRFRIDVAGIQQWNPNHARLQPGETLALYLD